MELKNMKIDKSQSPYGSIQPAVADAPEYPYGLRIHLDDDSLKKLGVADLPDVNAEMVVYAKVKVCSVSAHKSLNGEHRTMELQITDMALGKGKA